VLHLGTNQDYPTTAPAVGDIFSPGQRHGGPSFGWYWKMLFDLYGTSEQVVIVTQQAAASRRTVGRTRKLHKPVTRIDTTDNSGLFSDCRSMLGEGWVLEDPRPGCISSPMPRVSVEAPRTPPPPHSSERCPRVPVLPISKSGIMWSMSNTGSGASVGCKSASRQHRTRYLVIELRQQ